MLKGARPALAALALTAALVAALGAQTAWAHAGLLKSDPADGATLKTAPTVVTLQFAEDVVPSESAVVVYDAKHNVVSTGPATVDPNDAKTMRVNMQGDGADTYLVEWHNVSLDDNDPDIGAITFHVNPNATGTTDSSGGGSTSNTSGASGVSGGLAALIGVLGLIVGGAAGLLLGRRQRA
jgi:copper transport protein